MREVRFSRTLFIVVLIDLSLPISFISERAILYLRLMSFLSSLSWLVSIACSVRFFMAMREPSHVLVSAVFSSSVITTYRRLLLLGYS